jgi:glycosyltransferase involved in cell wall biosynthesis
MKDPLVSVVIPTRNRAFCLRETLPTYLNQTCVGEVVVVDDASSDDTCEVVRGALAASSIPVRYVRHRKRAGAPAARNTGIDNAVHPFLFFGEDDVFLEEGHIACLAGKMQTCNGDIISGRIVYLRAGETPDTALRRQILTCVKGKAVINRELILLNHDAELNTDTEVPFAHALILVKTDVAREARFDLKYPVNGFREETDFQLEVKRRGGRIILTPDTNCFHMLYSATCGGGQRESHWLLYEFWAFVNNRRFLAKHWDVLNDALGGIESVSKLCMNFAGHRWRRRVVSGARRCWQNGLASVLRALWRTKVLLVRIGSLLIPSRLRSWIKRRFIDFG